MAKSIKKIYFPVKTLFYCLFICGLYFSVSSGILIMYFSRPGDFINEIYQSFSDHWRTFFACCCSAKNSPVSLFPTEISKALYSLLTGTYGADAERSNRTGWRNRTDRTVRVMMNRSQRKMIERFPHGLKMNMLPFEMFYAVFKVMY